MSRISRTLLHDIYPMLYDLYYRLSRDEAPETIYFWITEADFRSRVGQAADGLKSHAWNDMNTAMARDWFFVADKSGSGESGFYMGSYMGVRALQEGDLVVVLFGLDMPCVLRRVRAGEEDGDGGKAQKMGRGAKASTGQCLYEFVGTAYVHDMMDGEAVDLVESGKAGTREFVLV